MEPLSVTVARRLTAEIEAGQRQPGERLSEEEIAAAFGVSRGPVREGLGRLVRDGLARQEPRRGIHVLDFTWEELRQIYEVRAPLYGLALRLFVANARDEHLDAFVAMREASWAGVSAAEVTASDCAASGLAATSFVLDHCANLVLASTYRRVAGAAMRCYAGRAYTTVEARIAYRARALMLACAVRLRDAALAERIGTDIILANRDAVMATLSLGEGA